MKEIDVDYGATLIRDIHSDRHSDQDNDFILGENHHAQAVNYWSLMLMTYQISVVIEKDEYGYYAYCPELKGCQTQGESLEEVKKNIQEAVELYLETLSEEEKREILSQEIMTMTLEVKVA